MAQGDATAQDVPGRYDVAINGKGYMLLQSLEPSLPFRTHRALYSFSSTFVDRSNVSNAYGDNAQDFFLTVRQRDWSFGEQQKFFRSGQDGRYWMGSNVDVTVPGQVTLAPAVTSLSFSGAVRAGARQPNGGTHDIVVADATNAYNVSGQDGTITSLGAHGLGAAPSRYGITTDAVSNFFSTTTAGTVGVRKLNAGSYSTFSTSAADSLSFLNNTLYGYRVSGALPSGGDLVQWDTSGTISSVFQWKRADGGQSTITPPMLCPFGGKLLIMFPYGQESSELWVYDGIGAVRLEVFPENFFANEIEVLYGVAYIGGAFVKSAGASTGNARPAVLFYDGSQIGLLWKANGYGSYTISFPSNIATGPYASVGINDGRVVFTDDTTGNLMAYNPATGGVSTIGSYTVTGDQTRLISTGLAVVHTRNQTTGYIFPSSTFPSSGYVISSLIDFDSSLTKQFRGVKAEFSAATDGDGGSVDIAYQIDSLTGAWTTLKTGATSGTEYTLSGVSGHSVAIKVTLNKGTSTAGPTLKNFSVRAAPQLSTYRERTYILDLSGIGQKDNVMLADGVPHPLSGHEQADNLFTAIQSTTPITVSDRFTNNQTQQNGTTTASSFTALCQPSDCEIYDVREGWDNPQYPGGYVAKITLREV